jgi:biopolymer transport protein ExbD
MRFHRNVKMLKGRLDAAPLVTVFFLLLIFVLMGTMVYTPGVHLELPMADDLPGMESDAVRVALDPHGRLYYENQLVSETNLVDRLRSAVQASPEPLALIVYADRNVTQDRLVQVTLLARQAGIDKALLATLPRLFSETPRSTGTAP